MGFGLPPSFCKVGRYSARTQLVEADVIAYRLNQAKARSHVNVCTAKQICGGSHRLDGSKHALAHAMCGGGLSLTQRGLYVCFKGD